MPRSGQRVRPHRGWGCRGIAALIDAGVLAQAVIELRAVSLRVDRLQLDALDVSIFFRSFLRRMDIQTSLPFPNAGERCEGPQVSQGVGIGFGEDVLRQVWCRVNCFGMVTVPPLRGIVRREVHPGLRI